MSLPGRAGGPPWVQNPRNSAARISQGRWNTHRTLTIVARVLAAIVAFAHLADSQQLEVKLVTLISPVAPEKSASMCPGT